MSDMQVSNDVKKILQSYLKQIDGAKKDQKSEKANTVKEDQVIISDDAADIARAREMAEEIPEVRQEKVAEIRKKIEDGEYSPPPEDIAKNIVSHYLIDTLA